MSARAGFTLVELIVAITILALAVGGLAAAIPGLLRGTAAARVDYLTLSAVEDRLQTIAVDPRYADLDSLYDGTESEVAFLPGFERTTDVDRSIVVDAESGRTIDRTLVTVTLESDQHPRTVSRSLLRGAP